MAVCWYMIQIKRGMVGMFDLILQHGWVLDGTGAPGYQADVGLVAGKIAAIGDLSQAVAGAMLDVAGRCVTPGFIDAHRHGEVALLRDGFDAIHLAQGLTTLVHGNCGLSAVPLPQDHQALAQYLTPITGAIPADWAGISVADYKKRLHAHPSALHHEVLVGSGTLRALVAGFDPAPLTKPQVTALHGHLERALAEGALGVSVGLGYAPECFYTAQTLCQALAPLERSGRTLSIHMRQEGAGVVEALDEAITLGRQLHTPIQVSHLKAIGNRGNTMAVMVERIAQARSEGIDISCDLYPYTAGSTQLLHLLPPEVKAGGIEAVLDTLQSPAGRSQLRQRLETGKDFENIVSLVGFDKVTVIGFAPLEGLTLAQIAQQWGCDGYEALFDTLLQSKAQAGMIDYIIREEDLALALAQPFASVISDATYPVTGRCHPRVYGAFPRVIETYVQGKQVLTLPQAIHKMTALPAQRHGLTTKGRLAVGMDGDICVFDPAAIHETATFEQPCQLATGMDWVLTKGTVVYGGAQ